MARERGLRERACDLDRLATANYDACKNLIVTSRNASIRLASAEVFLIHFVPFYVLRIFLALNELVSFAILFLSAVFGDCFCRNTQSTRYVYQAWSLLQMKWNVFIANQQHASCKMLTFNQQINHPSSMIRSWIRYSNDHIPQGNEWTFRKTLILLCCLDPRKPRGNTSSVARSENRATEYYPWVSEDIDYYNY